MSNSRQIRKKEEIKKQILDCAKEIISNEGIEALSIRKITNLIEYSPGIIYHYFKDKQDILNCIIKEGYKRILAEVKPVDPNLMPDDIIRTSFSNYITGALKWRFEWKAIMLSSEDSVLDYTSVLEEKSSEKRQALAYLCKAIEDGVNKGLFVPCDIELTAQSLWSAMFGLLMRLIIEKNITEIQRSKLIDRQLDILIRGILQ